MLPRPNAYDDFIAAAKLVVKADQVARAVNGDNPSSHMVGGLTLHQVEQLLKENDRALRRLRQGLAYDYRDPYTRQAMDQAAESKRRYLLRILSRLLDLEGRTRAVKGDWNGAMQSSLDALRMGNKLRHGTAVIGSLIADACEANGRHHVWSIVPHLNTSEARAAARALERLNATRVPYVENLEEEKWFLLASMADAFKHPTAEDVTDSYGGSMPPGWLRRVLVQKSMNDVLDRIRAVADCMINRVRRPWPDGPRTCMAVDSDFAPSTDLFLQAVWLKERVGLTYNLLLEVMLALHAYHLEKGRYPDQLNSLVPSYLTAVPADPFAMEGTLKYRLTDSRYLLYSVGPDSTDDGGRAILNPTKPGTRPQHERIRRRVELDSHGDIVAGIDQL